MGQQQETNNSNDYISPERRQYIGRFLTVEFAIYYVILGFAVCIVLSNGLRLSSGSYWLLILVGKVFLESHPNYKYIRPYLRKGWICGHLMDNSDIQLRDFRDNILILTLLMVGYVSFSYLASRIYLYYKQRSKILHYHPSLNITEEEYSFSLDTKGSPYYYDVKSLYNYIVSLAIISVIHGSSSIIIIPLMIINYCIAIFGRGNILVPIFTWVWNIAILYFCDQFRFFKFSYIHSSLEFLDAFPGFFSGWYVIFKITILRMISFNMDYYYCFHPETDHHDHIQRCKRCISSREICDKHRSIMPHKREEYSLKNYFGYTLYVPLYLSGPILTFNNYLSQLKHKCKSLTIHTKLAYGFRLLLTTLLLEWIMHSLYIVAIKNSKTWNSYLSSDFITIIFWNLIIIWLKLTIIWRFSRFWAMMDDILTEENMVRCMLNHYSGLGFWRAWHRSFNLWIIRYVYIPLGGKSMAIYNIWIIFTFVAFWHDKDFNLFTWGWLISLFIIPEIFLKYLMDHWKYYRFVAAFPAGLNSITMCVVNAVGFAVGIEGVKALIYSLSSTEGALAFGFLYIASYANAHVIFEIRELENHLGMQKNF